MIVGTTSISTNNSGVISGAKTKEVKPELSSRPSFISLEYSLEKSDALVVVSDNLTPKPGEEFSYSITYKNENPSMFKNASLKIILPSEVEYAYANREVSKVSGNTIEVVLGDIDPDDSGTVVITVLVKDDAQAGFNMVFTAVLRYSDSHETQLATTSYLTARVGQIQDNLSAFSIGSLLGAISTIWLVAFGLLVLMSSLISFAVWRAKSNSRVFRRRNFSSFLFSRVTMCMEYA